MALRIGVVAPARELDFGTATKAEAFVALAFVQGIGEPPPSLPGSGSGLGL